jgi:hypothetical protein
MLRNVEMVPEVGLELRPHVATLQPLPSTAPARQSPRYPRRYPHFQGVGNATWVRLPIPPIVK